MTNAVRKIIGFTMTVFSFCALAASRCHYRLASIFAYLIMTSGNGLPSGIIVWRGSLPPWQELAAPGASKGGLVATPLSRARTTINPKRRRKA
jgi:hypothetical protein